MARGDHKDVSPLSTSGQIGHFIKSKGAKKHTALLREAGYFLLGLVSLATVTGLYVWLDVPLVSTAFTYLVILILVSLVSNLSSSIVLSFLSVCCLSYFFAPPIYRFRVDYPQDLITISAFVITSFIVNLLVTRVRVGQHDHMRTCEMLRDANQRLNVTNKALRIENAERKRAERALRESEYKLRQIVETVPGLLWSLAPDGEPTHFNQRLLDYFGKSFEDFKHRGREAFIHPDDVPEHEKAFSHAIQTGTSYQGVLRLRRADGEYRWHHASGEPLRDQQGRIVQWYGLSVDIDEAKRAEDLLRRSEALLAEAQRLSHIGVSVYIETTILYWSEETYRIWGFDPAKGIPSREAVFQRIHPDDRDRVRTDSQRLFAEKRGYSIGFRIVLSDGTVKYLQSVNEPVVSATGKIVEAVATHVDVTERKCAEQALREREAKIRRLVDANIIGIFIWDFDGRILDANKAFLDIVGYDHEDLVAGRIRWTDLTPPEWLDRDARLIQEHRMAGSLQPFEKEYFRKDSSRVPVLIGVATFEEGGNQGVAFVLDLTERKRAEEALRESEYKLRQITETVPSLLWAAGPGGEPTYANQRVLDYAGVGLEDFKTRSWQRFLHPDDLPETVKAFDQAVQTGTSYEAVHRIRRAADGEYRWHHARGEPLRDEQGRIIQWYGLSIDIDEAKKAEDRLRRSEAYLAEAQRMSHTGSAAYNEAAILYWSEETYRIWGFDPAQGVPSREAVLQRIHPNDRDQHRAQVQRALDEKEAYSIAYRIVLPDGTVKHLESIGQPVFSASGELVEVVATQIDVTERKRAEEALRESEAKFRDYAETASDWFWETGPDYKFTLLTENAFGSDPAHRIGTRCWDHALDLGSEPEKWRLIQATLDSCKPFRDFVYCSSDGDDSPMYVRASGKPVFDTGGEFRGYRGTGTDVTAIVRAQRVEASLRTVQAELAHASRVTTLGQLTASIAHEITQPIASARNNARAAVNFLDRQPPELSEVREALDCIVGDADRAGDIIDRIRDHIKKTPPRCDRVDLNAAINEVIVLARSEITKNGVSVHTRLMEELLPVQGDRVQLQQVIMNLILNAVEAMSSVEAGARELLIGIEQDQANCILLAVRDSGPGIGSEHLERIFDAFYTTKSSGIGIGLSICRSIIEAHGGRLWAEPNEPRGAAFKFTLPSAEKELMASDQAVQRNGGLHEDKVADPSHQLAYEGNKGSHSSRREPGQGHWDRQS
jgi:PAS domain S-box-containing protein